MTGGRGLTASPFPLPRVVFCRTPKTNLDLSAFLFYYVAAMRKQFAIIYLAFATEKLPVGSEIEWTGEETLETIFHEWNAGSGRECQEFLDSDRPSLSVGDIVQVEGEGAWICAPLGWKKIGTGDARKFARS